MIHPTLFAPVRPKALVSKAAKIKNYRGPASAWGVPFLTLNATGGLQGNPLLTSSKQRRQRFAFINEQ
jgi:hypothetical protein